MPNRKAIFAIWEVTDTFRTSRTLMPYEKEISRSFNTAKKYFPFNSFDVDDMDVSVPIWHGLKWKKKIKLRDIIDDNHR